MNLKEVGCKEYYDTLYKGRSGYIVKAQLLPDKSFIQKHLSLDEIFRNNYFSSEKNIFFSMNTFRDTTSRGSNNVLNFTSFFVDVDAYKEGMSPDEILNELNQNVFSKGIFPEPKYVVFSGNGLYLVYPINETISRNKWESIEAGIVQTLSNYGSDSKVKDPARVLRVPGTINAKENCGKTVTVFDNQDCNNTYFSPDEISSFLSNSVNTEQKRKATSKSTTAKRKKQKGKSKKENKSGKPNKKIKTYKERVASKKKVITHKDAKKANNRIIELLGFLPEGKTALSRAADIVRIMMFHGKKCEGYREVALFYFRYFLIKSGYDEAEALKKTLMLNGFFAIPLSEREAAIATQSKNDKKYYPSNDTLLSFFDVTVYMQVHLTTIVSKECRKNRENKKKNRILTRKEKISVKCTKAFALISDGMNVTQVCKKLGISRSAFYKRYKHLLIQKNQIRVTLSKMLARICCVFSYINNFLNKASHKENIAQTMGFTPSFFSQKVSTFCKTFKETKKLERNIVVYYTSLLYRNISFFDSFFLYPYPQELFLGSPTISKSQTLKKHKFF